MTWKGELGDGHVHMTTMEYIDHKRREEDEKNKLYLRKLANNPALSQDARLAIMFAVYRIDDIIWLNKLISDLREEIKNLRDRK